MKAALQKRVKRLEDRRAAGTPQMPPITEEDRKIAERIVKRMYSDPERHARKIKSYEQAGGRNPFENPENPESPATACNTE